MSKFDWDLRQNFSWRVDGRTIEALVTALGSYDEEEYKYVQLLPGEKLFRYQTELMMSSGAYGEHLIKINTEKRLVYHLKDTDNDHDLFEKRGLKCKFYNGFPE